MTDPSSLDPASRPSSLPETLPAEPSSDPTASPPKGLRRRLRWSTRGGEIIRSNGPHEVSVVESSGNAVARTPIPPREETRSLSGDRMAFGPAGQGKFSKDRFETGQAGPKSGDRFEAGHADSSAVSRFEGGPAAAGLRDRMEGGPATDRFQDRMQAGPAGSTPGQGAMDGPTIQAKPFSDRFAGGGAATTYQDNMQGGTAASEIEDRMAGGGVDSFQDRSQGTGVGPEGGTSGEGPVVQADQLTDRYQGGGTAPSIEDRYQGAAQAKAIEDRFEGGGLGPGVGTGQLGVPPGTDLTRGRIDLPEDALEAARALHRGSRKPDRIDALLRQVPKPVFQPVEIFKDIEGLSQRMTGIRSETADIRRRLAPGLQGPQAATSEVKMRKVSSWQKKKLPT